MKIIGVLGGMGPQASIRFYDLLIKLSKEQGASKNSDYPHILLSNLPVPDLISDKNDEEKAVRMVEEEAKRLAGAGADFLVLPCNTMHLYLERYQKAAGKPFISMVDAVVKRVMQDGGKKVGLLGTVTTMKSDLYVSPLGASNIAVLIPEQMEQKMIGEIIKKIISGQHKKSDKMALVEAMKNLYKKGAEAIILGCTELPLILKQEDSPIIIYDSLRVLAESSIRGIY